MAFKKGCLPWNKGLTAKNDARVAKYVNKQKGQKRPSIVGGKNPAKRKDVRKKLVENNSMKNSVYRERQRIGVLESWKNKEKRKNRVDAMKGIEKTDKAKKNMSIARKKLLKESPDILKKSLIHFKGKRTNIEKIIEDILIKNKIKYEYDFKILRYCVDFAFIDKKIAIECDGEYWHTGREEQDRIRQEKIEALGWKFIRFTETKILEYRDECEKIILVNLVDNDIV